MEMNTAYAPKTLEEALQIRHDTHARPLAGGTDLMVQYRRGEGAAPRFPWPVLLLCGVDEMRGISRDGKGNVTIGALEISADIARSKLVPWHVRQAASRMGAISLRNQATIGGNIGNSSPKGDLPATLILLDAEVELASIRGTRRMLVDDFIIAAKKNHLEDDELITKVIIPPHDFTYVWYRKIGTRRANAISKLSLSAALTLDKEGTIIDFRASSGAAGPKVERSRKVEEMLVGKRIDRIDEVLPAFLDAYDGVISPHAMPEYRRRVTRNMLSYFLKEAGKRPAGKVIEETC